MWGSYLPPVAFKVFLGTKHPIHCHRNRKLGVEEKGKKKKKEVWESEALQFCYFAQIHKWQHAGRYAEACSRLEPEEQGLPVPKAQVLNPGLNQERAGLCRKDLCFSLIRELPVESGEVGQTYILLSVLHLKS